MVGNPYEFIASNPALIFWYAFTLLTLAAWVFVSYRKMFKWLTSVQAAKGRWEFFLLPPDDLTWEIAGILVVTGVNLALVGLFLHVTL